MKYNIKICTYFYNVLVSYNKQVFMSYSYIEKYVVKIQNKIKPRINSLNQM